MNLHRPATTFVSETKERRFQCQNLSKSQGTR